MTTDLQSSPKNATFKSCVTKSTVEMMYDPRSNGIQSSPKEMQLLKTCVSFGEECIYKINIRVLGA